MKDYAGLILNALLDKFERSRFAFLSAEELSALPDSRISLATARDRVFADYWVQDCYLYRPDIDSAARKLCARGFCTAWWNEGKGLLERIALCPDRVDEAFSYAGRTRRRDRESDDAGKLAEKRQGLCSITAAGFLDAMEQMILSHRSHFGWYTDESDLDLMLKMIEAVENQQDEIMLRNFSKRNFGDSKVFENNQTRILNVFNTFGTDKDGYESFDSLCKAHNIVRNEGFVLLKGKVVLGIAGQEFNLPDYPYVFPVPHTAIGDLSVISVPATRLIAIENLTTFNYFNDPDAVVVYLGGYAGRNEIEILKKIKKAAGEIQTLHMGDIDWGGFHILIDLRKKTGIDFRAFRMGIEELEEYRSECKRLTEKDRAGLSRLLGEKEAMEFSGTISYMLEHGYKLEQESLVF